MAKKEKKVSLGQLLKDSETLTEGLDEHIVLFGHFLNQHEKKRQNKEAILQKAQQMQQLVDKLNALKD